jgi:hypothetical protein
MNAHNFYNDLQHEQQYQNIADAFYVKHFGVSDIIRYNKNTEEHLEIQRQDIDVSFIYKNKRINISEKFRNKDFNDLYIEFYSKFPKIRGWLDNSQADCLAYFTPLRMILIDEKNLSEFYKTTLFPAVSDDILSDFNSKNLNANAKKRIQLKVKNHIYYATLIQAYNVTANASWHTIGIAIPLTMLDNFGVSYKVVDYKTARR